MRLHTLLLPAMLFAVSYGATSQSAPAGRFGLDRGQVAPLEIGLHYVYLHSNAPPGQCGCFSANGGGGTMVFNSVLGLSLVADLAAAHAGHVDSTTQNLTLFNVLGGLRYSYRSAHRYTPYVEGLAGKSNEFSNYAAVQQTSAFAASGGLGLNAAFSRYVAVNIVEADYIYSRLPNAANNYQNSFRISSGIIFRIGPR